MRKGIHIHGSRPDGVLLCDLGDHQMVLVNVVDRVKTAVLSQSAAERCGPWTPLVVKPADSVREILMAVVDRPGNQVPPAAVGALDFDFRDVLNMTGPTRREFADLLQTANLDVASELPEAQNFQDDPDFLNRCLTQLVPSIQQSGVEVGDPASFCALMHLERTGIMPRGVAITVAAVPVSPTGDDPAAASTEMTATVGTTPGVASLDDSVEMAANPFDQFKKKKGENPFAKKDAATDDPGDPMASDDESNEDEDAPEEDDEKELADGEEGDVEGDSPDPNASISAKVSEIDEALDTAGALVDELLGMLGIPDADQFENADKSLGLAAKLNAVRTASLAPPMPTAPIAPPSTPTPPPTTMSAEDATGKPELPPSSPTPMSTASGASPACIGKPNKKIEACHTAKK